MRELLILRDGTCRFPGCTRPGELCEIDHTIQWQKGGRTAVDNLACLCVAHHKLKDETAWNVVQNPDGTMIWTSPTGRVTATEPEMPIQATTASEEPPPEVDLEPDPDTNDAPF